MNTTTILGRLCADPELRATQSGKFVTGFTVAVNDGYGDNQRTYYIDCTAWQKTAEIICQHFTKGSRIALTGKITTRQYEDKEGKKRKVTEVLVSEFDFVDSKKTEPSKDPFKNEQTVELSDDLPF